MSDSFGNFFSERLAVQTFINGLRDPETQQALCLAPTKTLHNALAYELVFEAAKEASRGQSRVRGLAATTENTESELPPPSNV